MLIVALVSLLVLIVVILFSFPQFSPIPYYPTNKKDLPLIIKSLKLKHNQVVYDLGAGDGTVVFGAAAATLDKNLNTQFVAVDINPILVLIMQLKKLFHPNKKNIIIIWHDLFKLDLTRLSIINHPSSTVYLYVSPWFLEKIVHYVKKQMPRFNIVSYMYDINSLKKSEKMILGHKKIFLYNVR